MFGNDFSKLKIILQSELIRIRCSNTGTKNFAYLEVPVLRADKIGLNLGKPLTSRLCILDDPYMIPDCELCG